MVSEHVDASLAKEGGDGADSELGVVQLGLQDGELAIIVVVISVVLGLHDVDGEVGGSDLERDSLVWLDALDGSLNETVSAA